MSKNVIVSVAAQRRLLKDISDLIKKPLTEHGIYYAHDEDNILKGYAMLIGPSDTCYEDGIYLFELKYPYDFPFRPPTLTFCTRNGITRFHPNLYRNGKVCLSILNTWRGEQWTSSQTIRSILLTLITLFTKDPLMNEPGFKKGHHSAIPYSQSIEYVNYKTAIMNMIDQRALPSQFVGFYPIIQNIMKERAGAILKRLKKLSELKTQIYYVRVYNMTTKANYLELWNKIEPILLEIIEN